MSTRIDEITIRFENATPGPWLQRDDHDYYQAGTYLGTGPYGYDGRKTGYFKNDICRIENIDNLEFIKNAPEDVAFLLCEFYRLTDALGEVPCNCAKGGVDGDDDHVPSCSEMKARWAAKGGNPE